MRVEKDVDVGSKRRCRPAVFPACGVRAGRGTRLPEVGPRLLQGKCRLNATTRNGFCSLPRRRGRALLSPAVLCFTPLCRSLRSTRRITHSCCSRTTAARLGRPLHLSSPPQRPPPSTRPRHAADAAPPDPRRVWTDASLQQCFRNVASQVFWRRHVEPTFPPPEGEPRADGAALVWAG